MDYRKSMFSQDPLDVAHYGDDLRQVTDTGESDIDSIERRELAGELKLSCTNVMLQCLEPLDRCIFVFGTMFRIKSNIAAEVLDMSPDNYRQRLSRSKKKIGNFLKEHCELAGGACKCSNRIEYAMEHGRLTRNHLQYKNLIPLDKHLLEEYMDTMENIEEEAAVFSDLPAYSSTIDSSGLIRSFLSSSSMNQIMSFTVPERRI
mgnify:CR=1 FL=1